MAGPQDFNPNEPTRPAKPGRADHTTAGDQLDLVTTLGHELASLLDGSMRCLSLAMTALERDGRQAATLDVAFRRLCTLQRSLERMAELVAGAMSSSVLPLGSALHSQGRPATIGECLEHAAEVLGPRAEHLEVDLIVDPEPGAASLPSGALYAAVLNGTRNALDSIEAAGGSGTVTLSARNDTRGGQAWAIIEIVDDGQGLPPGIEPHQLFDHGITGRDGHTGIGLALARKVVLDGGGLIALAEAGGPVPRSGAILRIELPIPDVERKIGG